MNSNAHFEHVRHKYLIKLISWVAVYIATSSIDMLVEHVELNTWCIKMLCNECPSTMPGMFLGTCCIAFLNTSNVLNVGLQAKS